ncbi:hypothetical protein BKA62DRAFT_717288 [Auriculariales sp. MPI-PUGE-AT-0066]|nr:hypothetical protein BKA62DRAFT_717288 [Auriculariales sp. MPI-PUGE-AT-0066]
MSQSDSPIVSYPHPSHVRLIRAPIGPRPLSSASSRSSISRSSSGRSITAPILPTIPDRDDNLLQLPTVNESRSAQRSSNVSDATSYISHTTYSTITTPGFDFLESQFDALLQQLNAPAGATPLATSSEPLAGSPSISPNVKSTGVKSAIDAAAAARLEARKSESTFGPRTARRSGSTSTMTTTGRVSVRSRAASIQTKSLLAVCAPVSPTALVHAAPRSTVLATPPPATTAQHHRMDSACTVASDMTLAEEIDSSFFKTNELSSEVASLAKEYSSWKSIAQPLGTPPPSPPPSALVSTSSPKIPFFLQTPEMEHSVSLAPHYHDKSRSQSQWSGSLHLDEKASLRFQSDLEAQKFPIRGALLQQPTQRDRPATVFCLHIIKAIFASVALAILALCIYAMVRRTKA